MNYELRIKVVFFGTSDFAVPALEALFRNGYEIVAVVTNPDEPAGRKNILTPTPVKAYLQKQEARSKKQGIRIFQPATLDRNFLLEISDVDPDLIVVAAYGKIIPKGVLDIPKRGALNIHPSLLPRWRGPSPVQYTILNGDTETGVTIIKMDELMDHGPIVAVQRLGISKTTYQELHDLLAKLGAELLIDTLPKYLAGEIIPIPQDDPKATYCKKLTREDGRIDWSRSAEEIERMVRAFTPWPGAWTIWPDSGAALRRLRIESAEAVPDEISEGGFGFISETASHPLLVKTGRGSLAVQTLTIEGRKTASAPAFLRGNKAILGAILV